ncbi:MAG: hypothetical protein QM767_14550 [Anaeromyxobacter sp.]
MRWLSGESSTTWNGAGLSLAPYSRSSIRVAWRLKTQKFTPPERTLAPGGNREPLRVR